MTDNNFIAIDIAQNAGNTLMKNEFLVISRRILPRNTPIFRTGKT